MERRLERAKQVCARVGAISKATLYRWVNEEGFPRPVKLVGRSTAWDGNAVDQWIADRLAAPRQR
ncbi:MAG: AlpA family phage regulatory protein [Dokdonella sp.]